MKSAYSIIVTFILLGVLFFLTGCMTGKWTGAVGSTLDYQKVELIIPGKTNLSEILEWFGPPDSIIDGTQQIVDIEGFTASGSIPTRTLISPDGMVILIYKDLTFTGTLKGALIVAAGMFQTYNEINENELFIYLSKEDHTVEAVVSGLSAEERDTN